MSQFFASGSPNPRLHLTTSNDSNVGMGGPTNETIFHSSMPYLLIVEEYAAQCNASDNGYWVGTIPDPIINYMSNYPSRVIITELVYNYNGTEYTKMIYGGSVSTGAYGYQDRIVINQGPNQPVLISVGAAFSSNLTASLDLTCDFGYYPFINGGWDTNTSIYYGSGRKYGFQGSANGLFNLGLWGARTWKCYDNYDSPEAIPPGVTNTPFPADQLVHPTCLQRGYNRFYVKPNIPLINITDPVNNLSGTNSQLQYEYSANTGGPGGSGQSRSYISAPLDNLRGNNIGVTNNNGYPFTPVRVRWLVTNADYTGGAYNIINVFTGNDTVLSPTNFVINGVNIMNTSWRFINLVAPGVSSNRPDMEIVSANMYTNTYNPGSVLGMQPWVAAYGTGVGWLGGEGSGWGSAGFSLYKFQPSASWQVNTTVPSIGNQWGDVWSPSQNPLKAFAYNYGSVQLTSGQGSPTAGNSVLLSRVWLDMNSSRGGAVMMTMRFNDNYWLSASGPGGFNPMDRQFGGANSRLSMNTPNPTTSAWQHMVLSLPVGQAIPFYTVRCGAFAQTNGTAGYPEGIQWAQNQVKYCTFTYYLQNAGDGYVNVVVGMDGQVTAGRTPTQGKTQVPNITITMQKLA